MPAEAIVVRIHQQLFVALLLQPRCCCASCHCFMQYGNYSAKTVDNQSIWRLMMPGRQTNGVFLVEIFCLFVIDSCATRHDKPYDPHKSLTSLYNDSILICTMMLNHNLVQIIRHTALRQKAQLSCRKYCVVRGCWAKRISWEWDTITSSHKQFVYHARAKQKINKKKLELKFDEHKSSKRVRLNATPLKCIHTYLHIGYRVAQNKVSCYALIYTVSQKKFPPLYSW